MVEKDISDSSMLELITYEKCNESCILLKELNIIHQLLPCELDTSPISEASIINSTTIVELSKGHNLHVNPKLSSTQMKQLTDLLQKYEKAFA